MDVLSNFNRWGQSFVKIAVQVIQTRRLATSNSIRVTIFLATQGRGRPCKDFLLVYSLISVQNLVTVSHAVCVYVGCPKFWGMLGPTPLL